MAKSLDIWYVELPGGPLPAFVQIMPLGPKMSPPWGHTIYIGLFSEKHEKIFLSETIWPRVLIFGI